MMLIAFWRPFGLVDLYKRLYKGTPDAEFWRGSRAEVRRMSDQGEEEAKRRTEGMLPENLRRSQELFPRCAGALSIARECANRRGRPAVKAWLKHCVVVYPRVNKSK